MLQKIKKLIWPERLKGVGALPIKELLDIVKKLRAFSDPIDSGGPH
jgi:hypothetical protein